MAGFPKTVPLASAFFRQSITPDSKLPGLGSSDFARRYFRNRCFFLFLRLLRCFSSAGSLCIPMDSVCSDGGSLRRVSPFRDPWITGYLLLPTAYRSLSRLSSALSAKASALCPLSLDLFRFSPQFPAVSPFCRPCSVTPAVFFLKHYHLIEIWLDEIDICFKIFLDVFSIFDMQFSRCVLTFSGHPDPQSETVERDHLKK